MIVGSSPKTSSPTAASAIARRISGVGSVSVSERRSTTRLSQGCQMAYFQTKNPVG
jgi:flavin-binding protein dodecin